MATQPVEVFGEVIGYSAVVTHKGPYNPRSVQQIGCSTPEELANFVHRYEEGEFQAVTICLSIRGSFGDEEESWYHDIPAPQKGTKMQRLVCSECGGPTWMLPEEAVRMPQKYICPNCEQAAFQKAALAEDERRLYWQDLNARIGNGSEDDIGL
jgi:hypothetical protein